MNKEPNNEVELDPEPIIELVKVPPRGSPTPPPPPIGRRASVSSPDPESAETPAMPDAGAAPGNDTVQQMLPAPPTPKSDPPKRFNTAAPLAPPRPNQTGMPSRPSNIPPPSRIPAAQAIERMTELQEQLDLAKRTLATCDAEIRTLVTQRDARISELESVRSQLAAREFTVKELEFAVLARETKIRDLEKELESHRSPGEGPGDDLQQIRGIGRGFERELKRIGFRTFAQIAAWTPADVEEIAPRIKAQPERIRRDGWVQHASELDAKRAK